MVESRHAYWDWPARCHRHSNRLGIAVCTECGSLLCNDCRKVSDQDALARCPGCEGELDRRPGVSQPSEFDAGWLQTVIDVIARPSAFVRRFVPGGRVWPALVFGLVCFIVGRLAYNGWTILLVFDEHMAQVVEMAQVVDMSVVEVQAIRFAGLPLAGLLKIGLYAVLLLFGVMMSGAHAMPYRNYVRLYGFASAAYLLQLIPLAFGVLMAFTWILMFCWQALRNCHQLSNFQAAIATIPLAVGMVFMDLGGFA